MKIELTYKAKSLADVGFEPTITISTEGPAEAVEMFWDLVKDVAEKRGDVVA